MMDHRICLLLLVCVASLTSVISRPISCVEANQNDVEIIQSNDWCGIMSESGKMEEKMSMCCGDSSSPTDAARRLFGIRKLVDADGCRTATATQAYCRDANCAAQIGSGDYLYIDLKLESSTSDDDKCCVSCSCFGDPQCKDFAGNSAEWIVCGGLNSNCRTKASVCRNQYDHLGNKCIWNTNNAKGSPCQVDWSQIATDEDKPRMVMHAVDGFSIELVLGNRGIIESVMMTKTDGIFSMSADSCYNGNPRQGVTSNSVAWSALGGSQVPDTWKASALNKVDILWEINELDIGIYVEIVCTKNAFGLNRLNVQNVVEVQNRTSTGFCSSGSINEKAGTQSVVSFLHSTCLENLADLQEMCRSLAAVDGDISSCTAVEGQSGIVKYQTFWCENANLAAMPAEFQIVNKCIDEIADLGKNQTTRVSNWIYYVCTTNNLEYQQCLTEITQFGFADFFLNHGNGLKTFTGDSLGSCGTSFKQYWDIRDQYLNVPCSNAVVLQMEFESVWIDVIAIPRDFPFCDDSLTITGEEENSQFLFTNRLRFKQCGLESSCVQTDSCYAAAGFKGSFKYETLVCPTQAPSFNPSENPTRSPSKHPTQSPTGTPSLAPSRVPSYSPFTYKPTTSHTFECLKFIKESVVYPELEELCGVEYGTLQIGCLEQTCPSEAFIGGDVTEAKCNTITVERPYCSDLAGADKCDRLADFQAVINLGISFKRDDSLSCCSSSTCSCIGDPHCTSFNNVEDLWIICPATSKRGCEKTLDHTGVNQCAWIQGRCYPNPESERAVMNFYTTSTTSAVAILGYRGVIEEFIYTDVNGGVAALDANTCNGDGQYDGWSFSSGSSDAASILSEPPSTVIIAEKLSYYTVKSTANLKIYEVADKSTGVTITLSCHKSGNSRINIESLVEVDASKLAQATGFCVTGQIDGSPANVASQDVWESDPDGLEVCAAARAHPCDRSSYFTEVQQWCNNANLQFAFGNAKNKVEQCISKIGKSPTLQSAKAWADLWCIATSSFRPLSESLAVCRSNLLNDRPAAFAFTYGTGMLDSSSCGPTVDAYVNLRKEDFPCVAGLEVQYLHNSEWVTSFFVPSTMPPCDDTLALSVQDFDELFRYPIRFVECGIESTCPMQDKCSAIPALNLTYSVDVGPGLCQVSGALTDEDSAAPETIRSMALLAMMAFLSILI